MAGGRLFGGLGPDAPPGSGAPEGTALRLHGALDDARPSSGWDFGFSGFSMDIYIYGAHGIKIWIYPWKMLGLDISWTFQGTIWDFLKFPWTFQAKK